MTDLELFEWLKAYCNKQPHGEYLEKWERILEIIEVNNCVKTVDDAS